MVQHPLSRTIAALLGLGIVTMPMTAASAGPESTKLRGSIADRAGSFLKVIDRADIDASGHTSLADLLFDLPQSTSGNSGPMAGSSAQPVASVDLRSFGAGHTRILVDGRPAMIDPFSGRAANLNTIPLAAVERIEILAHGSALTQTTDATTGLVNIVLRKQATGVQVAHTRGNPSIRGGDLDAAQASIGTQGDRGSMMATVSYESRGLVNIADQEGGERIGFTTFGNNYRVAASPTEVRGPLRAFPGFDCSGTGTGAAGPADVFFQETSGLCGYNFNAVASANAATETDGLHVAGDLALDSQWTATMQAMVSRQESFGRYAPTPADVFVTEGSPNDPVPGDGLGAIVSHRFAAIGPRDTTTDSSIRDIRLGLEGRIGDRVDVTFGARHAEHQGYELGRNYVVTRLAEQAIQDGRYRLRDPFSVDRATLDSISATINRDLLWRTREVFSEARFDGFSLPGGTSTLEIGGTWRQEEFADRYDSLQASGQVSGSAGNSAAGKRTQALFDARWQLPLHDTVDLTLALQAQDDRRFGMDVANNVALSWRPWSPLEFHASWASGRQLPALDVLFAEPSTSAQALVDRRTCLARGRVDCNFRPLMQINVVRFANPELDPESVRHWNAGMRYAPAEWFSAEATYHRIRLSDRVVLLSPQTLVFRDDLGAEIPDGLGVTRDPVTGEILLVQQGYANFGALEVDGVDLNLRFAHDAGRFGHWLSTLEFSHLESYDVATELVDGTAFESDFAGARALPRNRATWRTRWTLGDWQVATDTSAVGAQALEDLGFGDFNRLGTFTTHDLQVSWQFVPGASIAVGATNLTDRKPPLMSGFGTDPFNDALYPRWGRTPYVRLTYAF